MSVTRLDCIDMLATKPGSAEVQLIVVDLLPWDDPRAHCLQLQAKLNVYLAFIESGALAGHPDVAPIRSPEVSIWVVGMHAPPPAAQDFFARVETSLRAIEVGFRFEHRPLRPEDN